MKKDYLVLLNQLGGNLASDVSTRCSGRPQSIWSKRRKLSSHQENQVIFHFFILTSITFRSKFDAVLEAI